MLLVHGLWDVQDYALNFWDENNNFIWFGYCKMMTQLTQMS